VSIAISDANTATTIAGWGRLPHMGVLRFSGPDALGFLQGQVSNDTTPLAGGVPVLAAYSTPQGRVLAILNLLPHSSGILGILPRDVAASTRDRLRKFVLRAKVKIEDLSEEFFVLGMDAAALRDSGFGEAPPSMAYREENGVGIAGLGRDAALPSERYWVIGDQSSIGGVSPMDGASSRDGAADAGPADIERRWRLGDVREGLSQVYAATSELFVAQMLNLDLVGGISFSKGCYTGQEIIARTQHLGRIKRRLSRLRLPQAWSIGQPLRLADGRSGRVSEIAPVGDGFEALAVLSLGTGAAGTADGGAAESETAAAEAVPALELPLPYRTG
jgi:folate-binding protein YgfZ